MIDAEGKQLGIYSRREALRLAEEKEVDLVEVGPGAVPPVCRLMDYGKFVYERTKREREARKTQRVAEIKEIRLHPKTAEHDVATKVRHTRKFIADGSKVRVRIWFRGRESWHPEIARDLLMQVAKETEDVASIEQVPSMEGRSMLMILTPKK